MVVGRVGVMVVLATGVQVAMRVDLGMGVEILVGESSGLGSVLLERILARVLLLLRYYLLVLVLTLTMLLLQQSERFWVLMLGVERILGFLGHSLRKSVR